MRPLVELIAVVCALGLALASASCHPRCYRPVRPENANHVWLLSVSRLERGLFVDGFDEVELATTSGTIPLRVGDWSCT